MSQAQPIGFPAAGRDGEVRSAIARAAQATGVDFDYLLAQAKLESSLNASAQAPTSSAAGLYQFTRGTWLSTLDRHAATHGLDWAGAAIDRGRVSDPALHGQIMALRFDPDASALMAAELANDNRAALAGALGREPDASELYMAHFLGSDGAARFLSALASDPDRPAASLLPQAAAANRRIFYDAGGAPRSISGVMALMRGKVTGAMEGGAPPAPSAWAEANAAAAPAPVAASAPAEGPIARQFHAVSAASSARSGGSMADTLRETFGLAGAASASGAPSFVRAAYGKLQAFGL